MKGILVFLVCGFACFCHAQGDSAAIEIETPHKKLEQAFRWAVDKARSHVQTGRTGVVDKWERGEGTGPVNYIPSYWGGYNFRTAFYSRDICHQVAGGHLLGLRLENYTMLREFAKTSTPGRKFYPLWALNFDGSPFKLDYQGDSNFVREVPAPFELVEKCHHLFRWTGDRKYIEDEVLWNYYSHIVTDFIRLHDIRIPNGVAEGDGSGDIFSGTATFNEERDIPLVEAGDGIACQYKAFEAYAMMAKARKEDALFREYIKRADRLKAYFNNEWSVKQGEKNLVRGYNLQGNALTNWGKENSWFMPMKGITEAGVRTEDYLDFIDRSAASKEGRPSNIEARSYLPETFFNNNRIEQGWKWMKDIIDEIDIRFPASLSKGNGNYPEISFVLISNVVEGLMGVEPDAPDRRLATISRLPESVPEVRVKNIPVGDALFELKHEGALRSSLTWHQGSGGYNWEARFYGRHKRILVNGIPRKARYRLLNGAEISYVVIGLKPDETFVAEIR